MKHKNVEHRFTRRKVLVGVAAAGAAAGTASLLAACGGSSSENNGQPEDASEPTGAPKTGGTLTVGIFSGSSTDSLDATRALTEADIARCSQLYDTLMYYDSNFDIQHGLAEEVSANTDATVWTIKIRDGVTFHDGKPLTAEDVKYTFLNITDPDDPGAAEAKLLTLDRDSLNVVDPLTLELTFTEPYAPFVDVLADNGTSAIRIVPEGYDPKNPIGTGPFKYESFTPGEQSVFSKNENYWRDGEPFVDQLTLVNYTDDSARVNALISGQVDAIAYLPNSQISVIDANDGLKTVISETGSWNPITMRTDIAPFDDVRVRQAFRLIANRPQMVEQVQMGIGDIGNDLFSPYDVMYDSELPQREQNIEEAKSLLRAANAENLEVELVTSPVAGGLVEAAQSFSDLAAEAGVTVTVKKVDPTTFFANHFLEEPLSQSYWGARSYLLQCADSMMPDSPYNETHWEDKEWLGHVQEAFRTTDPDKQRELIHLAQQIEYEEGGYIIWGFDSRVDAHADRVGGLQPDRSGQSLNGYRLREVWIN